MDIATPLGARHVALCLWGDAIPESFPAQKFCATIAGIVAVPVVEVAAKECTTEGLFPAGRTVHSCANAL